MHPGRPLLMRLKQPFSHLESIRFQPRLRYRFEAGGHFAPSLTPTYKLLTKCQFLSDLCDSLSENNLRDDKKNNPKKTNQKKKKNQKTGILR